MNKVQQCEDRLPLISIVIPVYNVADFLHGCLDSVLRQSYENLQIICVNDGSTDACGDILREYATRDNRIEVIGQKNSGLSGARNTGMKQVKGEYLFFLDGDDYLHPSTLAILLKNLLVSGADAIMCSLAETHNKYDSESMVAIREEDIRMSIWQNPLKSFCYGSRPIRPSVCNKLYRYELIANIKFVEGVVWEDLVWTTVALGSINILAVIEVPLIFYCQNAASISRTDFSIFKIDSYIIGIRFVWSSYRDKEEQFVWVKHRISYNLGQIMKMVFRTRDKQLIDYLRDRLLELKAEGMIIYEGMSWRKRIKLWMFLSPIVSISRCHVPGKSYLSLWKMGRGEENKIILMVDGGLGSQLNKYFLGTYMEQAFGVEVFYDLSWFEKSPVSIDGRDSRNFELLHVYPQLKFPVASHSLVAYYKKKFKYRMSTEGDIFKYPLPTHLTPPFYFDGHFMHWRYYEDLGDKLHQGVVFAPELDKKNGAFLAQIKAAVASVAVHIRRGDYVGSVHDVCNEQYYIDSIQYMKQALNDEATYFIFSNDFDWVKSQLLPNLTEFNTVLIEGNDNDAGYYDFHLISQCHHQIASNASFAYIGAWLNKYPKKIVVLPSVWMHGVDTGDAFAPKNWKIIDIK